MNLEYSTLPCLLTRVCEKTNSAFKCSENFTHNACKDELFGRIFWNLYFGSFYCGEIILQRRGCCVI